jgi:beta-ribofuranosylaminobenzene 5'-phosphate synthase
VTGRTIVVETAARLHFGLLDLRGALGRRFGGIGASAPGVGVRVCLSAATEVRAHGPDADRAEEFARRALAHFDIAGGADIRIEQAIPPHCGLGSGTQLALSVARGIAELHGIDTTPLDLARAVGRAQRSAVGTWTFAGGGFVVEGGRRPDAGDGGPLLIRLPIPPDWRCVLAMPNAAPGVSGAAEAEAFAELPVPDEREAERVAYLVLMAMLPALVEGDLATFGRALTEVQELNGRWFARAQGGIYAVGRSTDIVALMRAAGAPGVGQSSWGPAVYAIVAGDAEAERLASHVLTTFDDVVVHTGPFPSHGATITRRPEGCRSERSEESQSSR